MNVKDLKEMLEFIPDTAKIYSYADHGQTGEQVNTISATDETDLKYYDEDVEWVTCHISDLRDGDVYDDGGYCFKTSAITAVLIG